MLLSCLPRPILFHHEAPQTLPASFPNPRHTSPRAVSPISSHHRGEEMHGQGHFFPKCSQTFPWPWEIQRPYLPRGQGKGSEKWPHMSDHSFSQQTFHLRQAWAEETVRLVNLCPLPPPRTLYAAASDAGYRAFCWAEHFSGVKRPPFSLARQNHLEPLV